MVQQDVEAVPVTFVFVLYPVYADVSIPFFQLLVLFKYLLHAVIRFCVKPFKAVFDTALVGVYHKKYVLESHFDYLLLILCREHALQSAVACEDGNVFHISDYVFQMVFFDV